MRSHFFEFVDDSGAVHRVHELRAGQTYEVVVTTAGGLWRYRLRDSVRVTGFIGQTPALQFLGRNGNVSDLFGEKLSEAFVTETIHETLATLEIHPKLFPACAPDKTRLDAATHFISKASRLAIWLNRSTALCAAIRIMLIAAIWGSFSQFGYLPSQSAVTKHIRNGRQHRAHASVTSSRQL